MSRKTRALLLILWAVSPVSAYAEQEKPADEPAELSLPEEVLLPETEIVQESAEPSTEPVDADPSNGSPSSKETPAPTEAPADTLAPPSEAEEWKRVVRSGMVKAQKNDLNGAIQDYTKAIELNPGDAMIRFARAGVHARRGDVKAQIEDLSRAIELFPDMRFYYERGLARSAQKQWKEAIEDLSKTIELYPGHPGAYRARAEARGETGDLKGKREDLEFARKLLPETPAASLPSESFGQKTEPV